MARKDAPSLTAIAPSQKWKIPKKGLDGEWYPLVRVGRHIPFGYEQDSEKARKLEEDRLGGKGTRSLNTDS